MRLLYMHQWDAETLACNRLVPDKGSLMLPGFVLRRPGTDVKRAHGFFFSVDIFYDN